MYFLNQALENVNSALRSTILLAMKSKFSAAIQGNVAQSLSTDGSLF
jgi:hypothetical protein